jgi:AbrB family looped-hinge helix DNA binding protein
VSRVTSKLQVTVPKALADRLGIRPGDEIEWSVSGQALRIVPAVAPGATLDRERRLKLFDASTARQRVRQRRHRSPPATSRGWTRDELYRRGRAG